MPFPKLLQENISELVRRIDNITRLISTIHKYKDLQRACILADYEFLKDGLKTLQSFNSQDQYRLGFIKLMHQRREITRDTFLCPLAKPSEFANKLCYQLFHELFPDADNAIYFSVFAPDVKNVLTLDIVIDTEKLAQTGRRKPTLNDLRVLFNLLPVAESKERGPFIVVNHIAIAYQSTMEGNLSIFTQNYQYLSTQYPALYDHLKKHHANFRLLYDRIEDIEQNELTLRERLERLQRSLVLGGSKITGHLLSTWHTSSHIQFFCDYINSLTDEVRKQQILHLTAATGPTLAAVLTKLTEAHTQCVEMAANWLQAIMNNPANHTILDQSSNIGKKVQQQAIYQLNVTQQLEEIGYLALPTNYVRNCSKLINQNKDAWGPLLQNLDIQFYALFAGNIKFDNAEEFAQILVFLDEQQSKTFCKIFQQELAASMQDYVDFKNLLKPLSIQQDSVITTLLDMGINWLNVFKTPSYFITAFNYINPTQCKLILEKIDISKFFINAGLANFIKELDPIYRDSILDAFKPHDWQNLIKSTVDLAALATSLPRSNFENICIAINVQDFLKNIEDLIFLLRHCNHQQRNIIFYNFQETDWNKLIKYQFDFIKLSHYFFPEQIQVLFNKIKNRLQIKDLQIFISMLEKLEPPFRHVICEALTPTEWQCLIKCSLDFIILGRFLTPVRCWSVFEAINKQCAIFNEEIEQKFTCLFLPDQHKIFYGALSYADINNFIYGGNEFFIKFVSTLNVEQCRIVCDIIKTVLPIFAFKQTPVFIQLLNGLNPQQRNAVIELLTQNDWRALIKTNEDFIALASYFSAIQYKTICQAIPEKIMTFFTDYQSLNFLLKHFSVGQRFVIQQALQPKIVNIIKNNNDLENFLDLFAPDQRANINKTLQKEAHFQLQLIFNEIEKSIAKQSVHEKGLKSRYVRLQSGQQLITGNVHIGIKKILDVLDQIHTMQISVFSGLAQVKTIARQRQKHEQKYALFKLFRDKPTEDTKQLYTRLTSEQQFRI